MDRRADYLRSIARRIAACVDSAIGCLGVRAIESLDVRVANIVMKMMKKFVTSRFSNLGSAIPGLLTICFTEWFLPYSLVLRNKRLLSFLFL